MARPALWRATRQAPPPHWLWEQWRDELAAHAWCSAVAALAEFDASRGVRLADFVYSQVGAGLLGRRRREMRAARYAGGSGVAESKPDAGRTAEDALELSELGAALAGLPEDDRRLLVQIFWEGLTEKELAAERGVSRQFINKLKKKLLRLLREVMEPTEAPRPPAPPARGPDCWKRSPSREGRRRGFGSAASRRAASGGFGALEPLGAAKRGSGGVSPSRGLL